MTVEFKQDGQEVKIENIHQVIYDEHYKCVDCYDDHGNCKYNIDLNDVKWFTTYDDTSSEITEAELNIENDGDCDIAESEREENGLETKVALIKRKEKTNKMLLKKKNIRAKRRVIRERDRLLEKLARLYRYLTTGNVKRRELLEKQAMIMHDYVDILNERLDAWEE